MTAAEMEAMRQALSSGTVCTHAHARNATLSPSLPFPSPLLTPSLPRSPTDRGRAEMRDRICNEANAEELPTLAWLITSMALGVALMCAGCGQPKARKRSGSRWRGKGNKKKTGGERSQSSSSSSGDTELHHGHSAHGVQAYGSNTNSNQVSPRHSNNGHHQPSSSSPLSHPGDGLHCEDGKPLSARAAPDEQQLAESGGATVGAHNGAPVSASGGHLSGSSSVIELVDDHTTLCELINELSPVATAGAHMH